MSNVRPYETRNVSYVTENHFSSDLFNKRFQDLAANRFLVEDPKYDVANSDYQIHEPNYDVNNSGNQITVTFKEGGFIDHRGIRHDFRYGVPVSGTVTRGSGQNYVAFVIYYDKSKKLNYEVELRLRSFSSLNAAVNQTLDEHECLIIVYNTTTKAEDFKIPVFGKEYLVDLETLDIVLREVIRKEVEILNNRITNVETTLNNRITNVQNTLNNKIDNVAKNLGDQITDVENNFGDQITDIENNFGDQMDDNKDDMDELAGILGRTRVTTKRSNKDDEGSFAIVETKDEKGKPLSKSVLAERNSQGLYARRTVTVNMGTSKESTYSLRVTYDADGDWVSEEPI